MTVRVAVLSGFGINCERETMAVFEMAGATADRVHVNRLVSGASSLHEWDILAVPGASHSAITSDLAVSWVIDFASA